MLVIPPTANSEKYFTGLAKDAWTNYTLRDPDIEDSLVKGVTLSISCDLEEDNKIVPVKLHYRLIKDILYCFVEEL